MDKDEQNKRKLIILWFAAEVSQVGVIKKHHFFTLSRLEAEEVAIRRQRLISEKTYMAVVAFVFGLPYTMDGDRLANEEDSFAYYPGLHFQDSSNTVFNEDVFGKWYERREKDFSQYLDVLKEVSHDLL
jgi:hypothetical protein